MNMYIFIYALLCDYYCKKSVAYWFQATLSTILEHFNGSSEDSVVELINGLECDFLIYRKGNVYRVL